MTLKILKSHLVGLPNFAVRVQAYAADMRGWNDHMKRVRDDEANGVTVPNRHVGHPPPTDDRIVMDALNENGDPDFEVINDDATPEQLLDSKKLALYNQLITAQNEALAKIGSMAKRRLWDIKEGAIQELDAERIKTLTADKSYWSRIVGKSSVQQDLVASRPKEENDHLVAQQERRRRINAILLIGAQAHSDVEDLTVDNVDAWKLPDFNV